MKRIIKKSNKGFSLVELLVVVGFITSAIAVIYMWGSAQYAKTQAQQQILQVQRLKEKIADASTIVSTINATQGLTVLDTIVNQQNIIDTGMFPASEISGNRIINVFKSGDLTASAKILNVSSNPANPMLEPVYTISVTGIPKKSCGYLFTDFMSKDWTEIKVGNIMAKQVGQAFSPLSAAAGCEAAAGQDVTVEFTQSVTEGRTDYGNEVVEFSGATGRYVDSFNPLFRATIAMGGPGAPSSCTGGSVSSSNGNFCSCPAGTMLQGDRCEAIGTPGVCQLGKGWDIATKTCIDLPNPPMQGQAQVAGVYHNGQYVPQLLVNNIDKNEAHGVLSCTGQLRTYVGDDWYDIQERANPLRTPAAPATNWVIVQAPGTLVLPREAKLRGFATPQELQMIADRFNDDTGVVCGVCMLGEIINAQGRCTAIKG